MRFILGFKGVFMILYCINLLMIFYIFYQKGGIDKGILSGTLPITIIILTINIYIFEKMKNDKLKPMHFKIEHFLSVCRILLVSSMFTPFGIGIAFFFSPVVFVIWKPVIDLFVVKGAAFRGGYYFLVCFIFLILECTYYSQIKKLNNRLFPEKK